jgi:hypothetical protein
VAEIDETWFGAVDVRSVACECDEVSHSFLSIGEKKTKSTDSLTVAARNEVFPNRDCKGHSARLVR